MLYRICLCAIVALAMAGITITMSSAASPPGATTAIMATIAPDFNHASVATVSPPICTNFGVTVRTASPVALSGASELTGNNDISPPMAATTIPYATATRHREHERCNRSHPLRC